ncbi:MAG: efflux RND transporter periplasmic adaptor subunit [Planctomycetota bacterium]|jgi:RND family efflux transporter MFP subunit
MSILTPSLRASSDTGIEAITTPIKDVALSFVRPGRILEVAAREGDLVKANELLAKQDDKADLVRLEQLKADSANLIQIRAAEASLAQKRVDLKKLEIAAKINSATDLEVEHARLDVEIADLSLQTAVFEHKQAQRRYEEARLQIDDRSLKSPIDGRIESVDVEAGESVNALEEVLRVVHIDRLRIDVPATLSMAMGLKAGDPVQVQFPDPKATLVEGKVVFVAAVADAASGTLKVRVEVPNESSRPAGEQVRVSFPVSRERKDAAK